MVTPFLRRAFDLRRCHFLRGDNQRQTIVLVETRAPEEETKV